MPGKGVPDQPPGQGKTEGHLGADARQGCPDSSKGVLQETPEYRRIREVCSSHGGNAVRLLGFMHEGTLVVLTNGFSKKSQKTPAQEIALAEQRKKDYEKRQEH